MFFSHKQIIPVSKTIVYHLSQNSAFRASESLAGSKTCLKCKIQNTNRQPALQVIYEKGNLRTVFVPNFSSVGFCIFFASRLRMISIPVLCIRKGGFVLRQRIEARNVGWAILDVALSPDGRHLGRWSRR
jgi:hypothetical protein